jgi:N-dimethylarginine dimethylaminohydrolase
MSLEEVLAFADEDGRPHPETGPVSGARLVKEMAAYRKLLARFGVEILAPSVVDGDTAQLFTRDPCFVVGSTLFLGQLRDAHRDGEVDALPPVCRSTPSLVDLRQEDATIEGGDVLVLDSGRKVLVGTSRHTNDAGFGLLSDALTARGIEVVRVPHRRLHLDCCIAPLPDGSALFHHRSLPAESVKVLKSVFKELTPLDRGEADRYLAANLLWLDRENVVSGVQAKKTNARLRTMGFTVHELDFTNVKRMWGSFRCVTCPIRRG